MPRYKITVSRTYNSRIARGIDPFKHCLRRGFGKGVGWEYGISYSPTKEQEIADLMIEKKYIELELEEINTRLKELISEKNIKADEKNWD